MARRSRARISLATASAPFLFRMIVYRHIGTGLSQSQGDTPSDPLTGTRHDCDIVLEFQIVLLSGLSGLAFDNKLIKYILIQLDAEPRSIRHLNTAIFYFKFMFQNVFFEKREFGEFTW